MIFKEYSKSEHFFKVSFLGLEILSVVLIAIFSESWFSLFPLTLLNLLGCWVVLIWLRSEESKSFDRKVLEKRYTENSKFVLSNIFCFLAGSGIIAFSYYLFPKFYAVGFSLFAMAFWMLVYGDKMKMLLHQSREVLQSLWIKRKLNGVFFFALLPFLFDFHYMILGIPTTIYLVMMSVYFILLLSVMART